MATPPGATPVPSSPPPVYVIAMVKSLGTVVRAGWNAQVVPMIPNSVETLDPGLCAMLIAAVAVSTGCEFPFLALLNSVLHGVDDGPAEFTHAPRMSAGVSISLCGTTPLPLGVVVSAT